MVVGTRDSGKTSWANVLFGLTLPEKTATISREKVFGLSLLNEHTQLIFIDEFTDRLINNDQAKVLFQGGKSNNS